jgi:hypothetical protein
VVTVKDNRCWKPIIAGVLVLLGIGLSAPAGVFLVSLLLHAILPESTVISLTGAYYWAGVFFGSAVLVCGSLAGLMLAGCWAIIQIQRGLDGK